jgi:acylphosphatase
LSAANPTDRCRRRVLVTGRVQNVWFRASAAKYAVRAGVDGWVRNLPDGRVEAVLEGTAEAVSDAIDFCSRGPELARVDHIEVIEESPEGLAGFKIR